MSLNLVSFRNKKYRDLDHEDRQRLFQAVRDLTENVHGLIVSLGAWNIQQLVAADRRLDRPLPQPG